MNTEITKRKDLAIEAAKQAGKSLVGNFKKPLKVESKGNRQLVTNADLEAESIIINLIKKAFPEDSILSEESRHLKPNADFHWVIDPLDGTHNYIHGIDVFGTSIAVAHKDEVLAGVIYMPLSDELYSAQKGEGTYCNGKKVSVSKRKLEESTLVYDSSIRYDKKRMLLGLSNLADKVFNVRMFGSTARHLVDIAEGKIDLNVEFHDKVWDFAAGLLLVEEAGGSSTDFQGNKWSLKTKGYVASNGIMHKEVLELLK